MVASKTFLGSLALASVAAAANIDVHVGEGGLKFVPDNIKAKQGDKIVFHFVAGHHDVTLGKYSDACMPMDGAPIWSGVVDTVEKGKDVTFTVPIEDDKAKWFYCSVAKHCQNGMSLVVNEPASGDSQQDYKDRAKLVAMTGVPTVVRGGTLGGSGGSSPSSSPSSSSPSSSSSRPASSSSSSDGSDATLIPSGSIPSGIPSNTPTSGSTTRPTSGSTTRSTTGSATGSATGTAISGTTSPTASPGAAAGLKGSVSLAGLIALGAWVGIL